MTIVRESNFGDGDLRLERKQMEFEPVPRLRKTFTKETDSDNFVYGIPNWKKCKYRQIIQYHEIIYE